MLCNHSQRGHLGPKGANAKLKGSGKFEKKHQELLREKKLQKLVDNCIF